ncbi:methyl-accepting chemotaxis protein [Marinomonas agarivorans]|nr:methyl-accepting chemotaxis protein [Marinomonas agarivorans]
MYVLLFVAKCNHNVISRRYALMPSLIIYIGCYILTIAKVIKLTSFIYLLITGFLATTLYWSTTQFESTSQKTHDYNHIWSLAALDLKEIIESYLTLGEATQLQAATQLIKDTITPELVKLPEEINTKLATHLTDINASLNGDIRAAGKLSGNPFALVDNNQLQLTQTLDSYLDYINDIEPDLSEKETLLFYKQHISLSQQLLQLDQASQEYLRHNNATNQSFLIQKLNEFQSSVQSLSQLPKVDVISSTEEETDELSALMGWQTDDDIEEESKIEAIQNELVSWSSRYMKDVDNSVEGIIAIQKSKQALRNKVADLQLALANGTQTIEKDALNLQQQITFIFTVFIGLMVTVVICVHVFLSRIVLDGVKKLLAAIKFLAEQQSTKPMRVSKRKNELSQTARYFNRYLEFVEQQKQKREAELNTISVSLNQVLSTFTEIKYLTTESANELNSTSSAAEQVDMLASKAENRAREVEGYATETYQAMQESVQQADHLKQANQTTMATLQSSQSALVELEKSVEDAANIVSSIKEISEQTNLLSLNAAIEAARAGENGRGFAVVATEVRTLSSSTQESLTHINDIFERLTRSTQSLNARLQQIVAAQHTQDELTNLLGQSAAEVKEKSQQSTQLAQKATRYAGEQKTAMEQLNAAISRVKQKSSESEHFLHESVNTIKQRVDEITSSLGIQPSTDK